jgi:hypothetical protein
VRSVLVIYLAGFAFVAAAMRRDSLVLALLWPVALVVLVCTLVIAALDFGAENP